MKRQRHELVGRRAELDTLHRHSDVPALLVVRGPSGSGRTALLRRFLGQARDGGQVILDLGDRHGGPAWDEFRVRALLAAVRADFEALGGASRVAEAVELVNRLCAKESYATPGRRHRLLGAIGVLLSRIRERTRLVIVVDDADAVPVPALAPAHRAGHTVVAACGTEASRELCSLADRIIDLAPLTDDEVGRLLSQAAAAPVDDVVPRALRENLGPLYGNAGTLVSTVESLRNQGRLTKVHGVLTLRAPRAPIALPAGHHLRAEADAHGEIGRVLVLRASDDPGFCVDRLPALAAATGHATYEYGQVADRLVRAGVLVCEPTGRLRCHNKAIGAAVAGEHGARGEPELLGGRSAEFISAGDYEGLATFVRAEVERGAGDDDELAAAAALAAIHLGRTLPAPVWSALAGEATALADRWLAGEDVGVDDLAVSFCRFRRRSPVPSIDGGGGVARTSVDSFADARALRDLVPVFRSVLGTSYRPPADGPVAVYHRVCHGYADGDWSDALSAARELESMPEAGSPVLHAARLLAAEICGWRGEDRQAAAWLAAASEDTAFPGLRGWVATGLREHTGDDAVEYGWDWYTAHAGRLEEPGAARLLTRLAALAVDRSDRYRSRAVLRETRSRYGAASDTTLLVLAIVEANAAHVRAAERVVRTRGTRFELAIACQRMARLSSAPQPWLDEAYELARSIGAAKLVSTTKRTMAGCGVAVPVHRTRRSEVPAVSEVERRIVELIRSGKTNRQIALVLRMSAKTVEKHLTRLFAKAGCRTRHGLAISGLGEPQELVGA
jgi:DNA-binding CsgD family transcriptional regulator